MGEAQRPRTADYGVRALRTAPAFSLPARRVALAIDALRHGWPIRVGGKVGEGEILLPAETGFAPGTAAPRMLISSARAVTLKLANQREAAVPEAPVLIRAADAFTLETARAIADPALDLDYPMKGPFAALPLAEGFGDGAAARVAMELARLAGILPAFLVAPDIEAGAAQAVAISDLDAWKDTARLGIASRARLPVEVCENSEIVAFRSADDMREHVALVIGTPSKARVPLVRLHSECLTGDILGSLKCDCGPQLQAALRAMAAEAEEGGWGVLLYMRQEGRGIGLINKLRAYRLQDQGLDTVDANNRLGLPTEARDFPVAARMLDLLKVGAIRLMTNNPSKVEALKGVGVDVVERVAHKLPANPHNARYLDTKRDRTGHIL
ncbi:GTP cyclohydrolase II [Novosphingobium sp. BW1]|nr:GTP cyclohydrolase II [Novosphingobium sp. BW1]